MFNNLNLFSGAGLKLLSFLAENPGKDFYQRELAKEAGISVGAANAYLNVFERNNFVRSKKRGRIFFYSLNQDNQVVRQFKVFLTVLRLSPLIEDLKEHSEKVILYGSCAEGADTGESDVDLFILSREKDAVKKAISKYKSGKKISPLILNANEYARLGINDKPLYDNINKGIELWSKR